MYIKKNPRVTFRSNRRSNFKRNNNFSNNKTRNKGNVSQLYDKHLKMAKEASPSGDRIQSEYYYQFTDHYYRLMVELGINPEDNDLQSEKMNESDENNLDISDPNDYKKNEEESPMSVESNEAEEENIESIESIPFISKSVKKKTPRAKKTTI